MIPSNVLLYFTQHWNASSQQIDQLNKFGALIFATNAKFNLTGHKTLEKIYFKLIGEGMLAYEKMQTILADCHNLVDVGTGSGIPGILIKILFPELNCFLVEASQKKCNFLNQVISELGLEKISVINSRIENLGKHYLRYFDFITARALAPITSCLKWMSPYLNKNGRIVLPKSNHAQDEYNQSQHVLKEYHLNLNEISEVTSADGLVSYHTYVFMRTN